MSTTDFVTIYTDASFKRVMGYSYASWAFYAKCSSGKLIQSGAAPTGRCTNADQAEMYAICMAIWLCYRKWPDLKGFFINTDSMSCCRVLWPWKTHRNPERRDIVTFRKLRAAIPAKLWIKAKHVKAHQRSDNVRSYLNNLCDRMAKKARLE